MNNLIVDWLLILLLFSTKTSGTNDRDYCKLSNVHTMCLYKTISKNCVQYKTETEIVVRRIVNDHNMARSRFAGGRKGYFIPNMMKMYWDQELADLSARWACQCKGSLDADRVVSRFEVGQVVWTVMRPHNFTRWTDIWKYIIEGGTGFYQRNNWGRMMTNYDPADPLSLIYNPYVRFMGCTLAKYRIWSVEISSFAYTTTLVCNYGPVEDSYEKYPKEDWPCRDCPKGKPCFTKFYMRGNIMPPNLPNERNLCIDPLLEYQRPRPGRPCPVDQHGEVRKVQNGDGDLNPKDHALVETPNTPSRDNNVKNQDGRNRYRITLPEHYRSGDMQNMFRKIGEDGQDVGMEKDGVDNPWLPSDTTARGSVTITKSSDHFEELQTTKRASIVFDPNDYADETSSSSEATVSEHTPSKNDSTERDSNNTTARKLKKGQPSTTELTDPANNMTVDYDKAYGYHDPNEEEYDYHGPMDMDGNINYCEVSCVVHAGHTLCIYFETSPDCGHFTSLTNSMTEDDLLHLHNDFRNKYTEGSTDPRHPLVSNMARLQWSDILKEVADMWLRQCRLEHDSCRDAVLKHPATGKTKIFRVSQNIAWKYFNPNETCPSHRELFEQWKVQGRNFTSLGVEDYLSYTEEGRPKVDDFVQLIWARTNYVGCAYGSFTEKNSSRGVAMLICNYAPMGKEVSKSIYIPGGPCSNCYTETNFVRGHCSLLQYPNLCDGGTATQLPSFFTLLLISLTSCVLHTT